MMNEVIKSPELIGRNNPLSKNEYSTPQWFFDYFDKQFNFTLDVAATKENAKCGRYFTIETNGLLQSWRNEIVWMNSPFGNQLSQWIAKAHYESSTKNATVVCLMPARTCTKYFHEHIMTGASKIYIIKGRLAFDFSGIGISREAPFSLLVVVFEPSSHNYPTSSLPQFWSLDLKEIKAKEGMM